MKSKMIFRTPCVHVYGLSIVLKTTTFETLTTKGKNTSLLSLILPRKRVLQATACEAEARVQNQPRQSDPGANKVKGPVQGTNNGSWGIETTDLLISNQELLLLSEHKVHQCFLGIYQKILRHKQFILQLEVILFCGQRELNSSDTCELSWWGSIFLNASILFSTQYLRRSGWT